MKKNRSSAIIGKIPGVDQIMWSVVLALLPAMIFSIYSFGLDAVFITMTAILSCIVFEFLICRFFFQKKDLTILDGSAVITGILLAFNVPSSVPLWMIVAGSLVAIGIAKMPYGGIGKNIFNPALVGRMFLLVSFPIEMTTWPFPLQRTAAITDAISGPTALGAIREGMLNGKSLDTIMQSAPSYQDMFLGNMGGSLGEISAIAIILGAIYLLFKKIITWHIPFTFIATVFIFTGIAWMNNPDMYADPVFHILAGGLILGATFMATDMTTSPMTKGGKIIFGIGCGIITSVIRLWGSYPEGVGFAILIMNAFVPLINKGFKPTLFRKEINLFSYQLSANKKVILFATIMITVMISLLVLVYKFAKDPIIKAKEKTELEKLQSVLPPFDNNPLDSVQLFDELIFYTAKKGNKVVGYACNSFTEKGFNGKFSVLVGFKPDGIIYKSMVLKQNETPGFGDRMNTSWNEQFNNKDLTVFNLRVKKDSGNVDAITGSTISSKAYCDAIEKAYLSLMKNILKRCDFKLASDKNKTCVLQDIALLKKVLPPFDNDPFKEVKKINDIEYYPASKNNISVGYAIKTFADGYSGPIWILTGILPDGKINGVHLLQHTETIGYGDKLTSPEFLNQFKGKVIGKCMMEVKKDGGEIDAISGSTVSSRAFCEAIIKAAELFTTNLNSVKETVASNDSLTKEPTKPIAPTTLFKLSNKSIFTNVIPEFNNDPLQEFQSINGMDVYTGKMNGTITGYAITAVSKKGFGGKVFMLVGFKPDGTIHNTAYVSHNETPSFIDMIEESEYRLQFIGKNPANYNVAIKSEGGEIDAVSGVTYTSRAISESIQKAYNTYIKIKK